MKQDRIAMYRFLSIGFTYPEDQYGDVIKKGVDLVSASYTRLNKSGYKLTGIQNLKKGLNELINMRFEEWQAIYTSLFIANYPSTPLHPYESFYKEGIIGGEISDQLNEIYKSCGLEIFDEREFPDYLVFELEYASFLIENDQSCKPMFEEFFFNHLFEWVPTFFNDVINYEGTHTFYRSLGEIGASFLKKERKIIEEFLSEG